MATLMATSSILKCKMQNFLEQSPMRRQHELISEFAVHVASELWGPKCRRQHSEACFYLEYYNAKIDCLDPGRVFCSSHREVLAITKFVKERKDRRLIDLREDLADLRPVPAWLRNTDETTLWQALTFGASLWLFVDTSRWEENESLQEYVRRLFAPTPKPCRNDTDVVHLTARVLCHIGGVELVWTSNVCQHLKLEVSNSRHPQLYLFRHGSYLSSQTDAGQHDTFPNGLLRETAETLALLFPFAESPRRRWYRQVRKRADLDVEPGISCNTPRDLGHYHYWKDRLEFIQQPFDRSKPDSLSQWFYDKRDSDKFYTFWFAVVAIMLALVFGLIQSITGIIQAIKS